MLIDCSKNNRWNFIASKDNGTKEFYCCDNAIVKLQFGTNNYGQTYFTQSVVAYVSNKDKYFSVLPCTDCGCLPELRIDKNSGLYYCTCPSSFYRDNQEIGDKVEPEICNCLLFDNIPDAIDAWNEDMSYRHIIPKIKEIANSVDSYEEFSKKFDETIFVGFTHQERDKLEKLFSVCQLFFQNSCCANDIDVFPDFYQSIWNNSKDYYEAKETFSNLIDNLKKIIYFNFKHQKEHARHYE